MEGMQDKQWLRKHKVYLLNLNNTLEERRLLNKEIKEKIKKELEKRKEINTLINQIKKELKKLDDELLKGNVYR